MNQSRLTLRQAMKVDRWIAVIGRGARRVSRYESFVSGSARSVYQVRNKNLEEALEMSPYLEGVRVC